MGATFFWDTIKDLRIVIMSDKERDGEQGFKVVDKRRFDGQGNEKELGQGHEGAAESDEKAQSESSFTTVDAEERRHMPEITFSSFIMSLATQTLVLLGELKPPSGIDITVDKDAGKQTIDILQVIRDKTRGNLTKEEDDLFEEILHNLRISYVKVTKQG